MTSASMIDPHNLMLPFVDKRMTIGVIDLDRAGNCSGPLVMPAFPLIGIGDPTHPLAPQLDAIAGNCSSLARLETAVRANPLTAAVAVQTLRLTPALHVPSALIVESMAYGLLQGGSEHSRWRERQVAGAPNLPGQLSVDRQDNRLDLCIDRPHAHNAIDRTMRDALREAFELAALDSTIDRIMLRSKGRAFSVGADLAEFGTTRDAPTAHAIRIATLPAHAIALCADRLQVHVQGACVGSALEMAAFASRITATPRAWFQLPELAMGVIPGAGGCVSIPRRIGRQRTTLMILSGHRIDARTALDWGLIDAIIDD